MMRLLYDSRFEPTEHGHGGSHRTLQIVEVLRGGGYDPVIIPDLKAEKRDRLVAGAKAAVRDGAFTLRHARQTGRIANAYGREALRYDRALDGYTGAPLVVWEATRHRIVPALAAARNLRVLAAPQNLEAMIEDQEDRVTGERLPTSLERELDGLRAAAAVITISREEQWFLAMRGIESDYLPTFPAPAVEKAMLRVRELRATRKQERLLVLGTAHNPPTRTGTIAQLRMLAPVLEQLNLELDVAGFGTETLRDAVPSPRLHYHGSVSAQQLESLLAGARAILIHQLAASGALTRIPEMLVAGVPVVGNAIACRSAFTYAGVTCYDSPEDLTAMLRQPLSTPPIPAPPRAAEQRFLATVARLVGTP